MRKVLVIGAGGIGGFLIPLLDKVGLYSITVADPDKVETKNLTYQISIKMMLIITRLKHWLMPELR